MRYIRHLVADSLAVVQIAFLFILLLGWAIPGFKLLYLTILFGWFAVWIRLGFWPLTWWEFMIRRLDEPGLSPREEFVQHYLRVRYGICARTELFRAAGAWLFVVLFLLCVK